MTSICFYLHAHQPIRLRDFSIFDIGRGQQDYFNHERNIQYLKRVSSKSYVPANELFLNLIKKTKGKFRLSFSISGILLEQLEKYNPKVIELFQSLAKTGACEFLAETYYHSLASYFSEEEFRKQVLAQEKKIDKTFGRKPEVFRNTELLYYNNLAPIIYDLGYKGVLIEGADKVLNGRSPNFVYYAKGIPGLKLLLKHYRLSDDIAFRFSNPNWQEFPLTADKFLAWIKAAASDKPGGVINLFMDYETFGEHQWKETGIFDFFEDFVLKASRDDDVEFLTPSEVIQKKESRGELEVRDPLTWADTERDLSAWLGNILQKEAAYELYALEGRIKKTKNKDLVEDWRKLQVSDHFYYMCTKWFNDGDVHKYFNPYESPYDAYINYMNVLRDLEARI